MESVHPKLVITTGFVVDCKVKKPEKAAPYLISLIHYELLNQLVIRKIIITSFAKSIK